MNFRVLMTAEIMVELDVEADSRDAALEQAEDMACDGTWQNHTSGLLSRHDMLNTSIDRLDWWPDDGKHHIFWPDEGVEIAHEKDI